MKRLMTLVGACALVAACGGGGSGGGGGDDGGGGGGGDSNLLTLTADNAAPASSMTLEAAQGAVFIGNTSFRILGLVAGIGVANFEADASKQLPPAAHTDQLSTNSLVVITQEGEGTFDCDNQGGKYIVDIDDKDGDDEAGPGDRVDVTFQSCELGGETFNGLLSMTINQFEEVVVGITFNFTDFSTDVEGAEAATLDGDITFTVNGVTIVYEGNSLKYVAADETTTVTDYKVVEDFSNADFFTFTGKGAVDSTEIGGSVNFEITEPFQWNYSDVYPSNGTEVLTGADDSSVTFEVLDNVNVRLSVDGETNDTTWQQLEEEGDLDIERDNFLLF